MVLESHTRMMNTDPPTVILPHITPPESRPVTLQPDARRVLLEGSLYFLISALTPAVAVLESTKELSSRCIVAMILASIVAGSVALKAFLSKSHTEP